MAVTVRQLAELVHGTVVGDGDLVITSARVLDEARPGDITFLENDNQAERLHGSQASAAVVSPTLPINGKSLIQVKDPLFAFVAILQKFQEKAEPPPHGIDPRAAVDPSATLGPDPSIHPFAVVGAGAKIGARCRLHPGAVVGRNCRLGDDVVLHPHVVLYDDTVLGDRVILHAGAVIGADGYGYRHIKGRHVKIPQLGYVEIGNDVEIGANSAVDRATFGVTRIGPGSKIDNLVQIAHNVQIGKHNLLAAQVGIAGSSSTGDYVMMGGQAGVSDHNHVGAGTAVGAQSGVIGDIKPGAKLFGTPAGPAREQMRIYAHMAKLPEMRKTLQKILKHLGMEE